MIVEKVFGGIPKGVMIIEDPNGDNARLLALHFADFALEKGLKVEYLTFLPSNLIRELIKIYGINKEPSIKEIIVLPEVSNADLVIVDPFTLALMNVDINIAIEIVRKMQESGKSYILIHSGKCVDEKIDAILKLICDSFVEIKTEIAGERIARSIQLIKVRGKRAYDKLIKFTVEAHGMQIDTRETFG